MVLLLVVESKYLINTSNTVLVYLKGSYENFLHFVPASQNCFSNYCTSPFTKKTMSTKGFGLGLLFSHQTISIKWCYKKLKIGLQCNRNVCIQISWDRKLVDFPKLWDTCWNCTKSVFCQSTIFFSSTTPLGVLF